MNNDQALWRSRGETLESCDDLFWFIGRPVVVGPKPLLSLCVKAGMK